MSLFDFLKKDKNIRDGNKKVMQSIRLQEQPSAPESKEELKSKFLHLGLGHIWEKVSPFARNSIRIEALPATDGEIAVGATKLGGSPDLPQDTEWPYCGNFPLSFIAQVNFTEVKPYDLDGELPDKGMLYFFYDLENQPWGNDLNDKDGFRVLFCENDSCLTRTSSPKAITNTPNMPVCWVSFFTEPNVPDYSSAYIEELAGKEEMGDKDWDKYCDNFSHEETTHKLLGYSDNIQNPMEDECQFITNGLFSDGSLGHKDPRTMELMKTATDWKLLLQVDSNITPRFMWGDGGRLYLWILKKDLEEKNFSNTWLILQCY